MPLLLRRMPLAVMVSLCLGASAGCAASTLSGHGSAGVLAPITGFPAPPSSGVPTSNTASPPSSAPGTPAGAGVLVTDERGKFVVRMPAQPERTSEPGSFGDYHFTVYVDAVKEPYIAVVEGENISPALPEDQLEPNLRTAVSSFQISSGLTLVSQHSTTFQGHQARAAILEHAGSRFELLAIGWSGSELYVLLAPEGDRFRALARSFRSTA